MMAIIKRRMFVGTWKCSKYFFAFALFMMMGFAVCIMSSDAHAGGVRFGFGVDVPLGGEPVPPPMAVYGPPVVVERTPPPPQVVVERPAPPSVVVVRPAPPTVVYEEPVIVERRSTTYYYPQSYQYRPYHEETERGYYRQRSSAYEDDE